MRVEVEEPHVHQHKTGYRRADLILPIVALIVSFVSIGIAWHHAQVMTELVHQNEKLVEANSLPYVQVYDSNANHVVSLNVTNEGVGPAKIETSEVSVDGKPVQNLEELLQACCGTGTTGVNASSLDGRMVRPGETVAYVSYPESSMGALHRAAFDRARQTDRIVTRVCYCSVFDDCWMADSRDPTPDSVKQCTPPKNPYTE